MPLDDSCRSKRLVFLELVLEGRRLDPFLRPVSALGWVAAYLRLHRSEVDEMIRLAAELVGDHRRLGRQRRDDAHFAALALYGLDQGAEVAVAGEEDEMIDPF